MKTQEHLKDFLSNVGEKQKWIDFKTFKTKDTPITDICANSMSGKFSIIKEIMIGICKCVLIVDADEAGQNTYVVPYYELRDVEYIKL